MVSPEGGTQIHLGNFQWNKVVSSLRQTAQESVNHMKYSSTIRDYTLRMSNAQGTDLPEDVHYGEIRLGLFSICGLCAQC